LNGNRIDYVPELLSPDVPIYSDGSAHVVGTRFASAGAAAVYKPTIWKWP
jgi:hypothetical protein